MCGGGGRWQGRPQTNRIISERVIVNQGGMKDGRKQMGGEVSEECQGSTELRTRDPGKRNSTCKGPVEGPGWSGTGSPQCGHSGAKAGVQLGNALCFHGIPKGDEHPGPTMV